MDENKSKVYIQTDDQDRILRCDGGYTTPADLTGWICIDEGTGDRYNLCQSNYFDSSLYTHDGIPRYRLDGSQVVARTAEEIDTDRVPLLAAAVRAKRDELLRATDWTQVLDSPIDENTREVYRVYRQNLRDIPERLEFPQNIVWPVFPLIIKTDK